MAVLDKNGNEVTGTRETFEANALNAFNVLGNRIKQLESVVMQMQQQVVSLSFLNEYLITKIPAFNGQEFQAFIEDKLKSMQAANTEFNLEE